MNLESTVEYLPSATATAFHNSPGKTRLIAGPIGSGKSVSCVFELLCWAYEQMPDSEGVRRTRFAIVRNTVDQLKTTTMKTAFEWLPPGIWGEHRIVDKTFVIRQRLGDGTTLESEWLFLSLDNPADTRKALSLELTGVWLNEAREIHPDVIEVMPTRTGRFPREDRRRNYGCTRSGMIMDTNMPPEDSWFGKRMEDPNSGWAVFRQPPAALAPGEYLLKYGEDGEKHVDFSGREWVINPEADNLANLKRDYYPSAIVGKSADFVDVYVLGRFGRELGGRPVYEGSWSSSFHILDGEIKPLLSEDYPIVIGQDFGRTPASVFLQADPRGRVTVLGELSTENCGIERYIRDYLQPYIRRNFPRCSFVVAPDPAGYHKQQVGEMSMVDILKKAGFAIGRVPSNDPTKRIAAVEQLLLEHVDGKARFRVHRTCRGLIRGFEDKYRYRLKKNGEIEDKPDKNEASHLADSCQYAVSVVSQGVRGWSVAKERVVETVEIAW